MDPLRVLPTLLRALVATAAADRRAGDFALVEHVWHLAELEAVFHHRIDRILREATPRLADVDGTRLARERRYVARDIADGLARFEHARDATIARFAQLAPHHARRAGVLEGVGPIQLDELPARLVMHDCSHARELAAIAPPRLARQLAAFGRPARSPCEVHASYLPRLRWLFQTRELVARAILRGEVPTLDAIAARLATSTRSLQRRLRAQGLGFRCLLEETRQELAVVRLARGDDIAQITSDLGYTDRRTAVRALRRWQIDARLSAAHT